MDQERFEEVLAVLLSSERTLGHKHGWVVMIPGDNSSKCWFRSARNAASFLASQSPERIGTKYEYTVRPALTEVSAIV